MAGRLEKFYEDAFGTPQSRGELYTGFFLMISGFILAVIGIVLYTLYLGESTNATNAPWKETGAIIAALGPPAILMGISVALPTKWTMRILDGIGIGLCLTGLGVFMYLYPYKWNVGVAKEPYAIIPYLAGCAALVASTISSIIGYWVSRQTGGVGGGGVEATASEYNYDIPDSVIEKDIELAMRRYNVSWGGEGGDAMSKGSIQFDVKDEFTPGTVIGGKGVARSVTLDAPQVDMATDKLRSIRGGKGTTSMDTKGVDDSTDALLKFRQKKQELEVQRSQRGFWNAIKRLFGVKPKAMSAKPTPTMGKAIAPPLAPSAKK
ncbi:MAG: hypothetical protein HYT80_01375 [Euryarchaeota archaeon]|nr:hypothetical protein [Euryarchaeota archaeon]